MLHMDCTDSFDHLDSTATFDSTELLDIWNEEFAGIEIDFSLFENSFEAEMDNIEDINKTKGKRRGRPRKGYLEPDDIRKVRLWGAYLKI